MTTRIFHLATFMVLFGGVVLWFSYFGFNLINKAESSLSDNVSDWGWSDNVGWFSTNCNDTGSCSSADYGVNVDTSTGEVTGAIWSENVGWISFDRSITNNPPEEPFKSGSGHIAEFDQATKQVTGWARAISGCQDNPNVVASICNSTGAGLASGGWDGWIKLHNVNFNETTGKLEGWAWGADVTGWVNFDPNSIPPGPVPGSYNVSGWGWSDNTGWVSTNCDDNNPCPAGSGYGVNVDIVTGEVTGTMWSDSLGWISFDRTVTSNPPAAPFVAGPGRIAEFDQVSKKVTGWARALSGCQDNPNIEATTCVGTGAGAGSGDWDGWISLHDITYTGTGFKGWAWGADVAGWISFDSPMIPFGTITAENCTILKNNSSCISKVTWTSENFVGGASVSQGAAQFSNVENNAIGEDRTVNPNDRTITLKEVGGTYSISKTVNIACELGSGWNNASGLCEEVVALPPVPTVGIEASPTLVRKGQTAEIVVTVDSPEQLTCSVYGVDDLPNYDTVGKAETFTHDGSSLSLATYSDFVTKPLNSAQVVKVSCLVDAFPGVIGENEVRVNVVSTGGEI